MGDWFGFVGLFIALGLFFFGCAAGLARLLHRYIPHVVGGLVVVVGLFAMAASASAQEAGWEAAPPEFHAWLVLQIVFGIFVGVLAARWLQATRRRGGQR
jgi:predicted tellurium resistance membrane protein TerC